MTADVTTGTPEVMAAPNRRGSVMALVAFFVVAMNLRPGLSSVSPLLPTIERDFGVGPVFGGLVTTIPVVCMGVLAPLSIRVATRLGTERTILGAIVIVGVTTLARLVSPVSAALLATALGVGVGIAMAGTLLPPLAKAYFPGRVTLVTGLYATGINLGAGCAALATGPITEATGGSWRTGLACWSLLSVVAVILWLPVAAGSRMRLRLEPTRVPLRSSRAWAVTALFGAQSFVYYGILTWLATLYEERGWSRSHAGALLAFFTLLQMIGAVGMSAGAHRSGDAGIWIRATLGLSVAALLWIALVPDTATWVWVAILGLGVGGIFPLSMSLPLLATTTTDAARAWMSMTLGVGYVVAAAGPFAVGALRSATGGFAIPFVVLGMTNLVAMGLVSRTLPRRCVPGAVA